MSIASKVAGTIAAGVLKLVVAGVLALGFVLANGGFRGRQGSFETDPVLGWSLVAAGLVGLVVVNRFVDD